MTYQRANSIVFWVVATLMSIVTVLRVRAGTFGPLEYWGTANAVATIWWLYHRVPYSFGRWAFCCLVFLVTYIPYLYYWLR